MKEYCSLAEDVSLLFDKAKVEIDDDVLYYLSLEDWKKTLSEITSLPEYEKDRFDCDNYADYIRDYLAVTHKLNGCGKAWGHIPEMHCFCVLLIPGGFICYEPQTQEFKEYPVERVYFG
jgi:hypothetical protein